MNYQEFVDILLSLRVTTLSLHFYIDSRSQSDFKSFFKQTGVESLIPT